MTAAQFLAIFGEFGNVTLYPTATITFWLSIAAQMIDPQRWGTMTNQGTALLTAHYLVLAQQATTDAALQNAGYGALGSVNGVESSKSVDGVSVSQDVASITIANAGMFNKTSYGIQYWQLARWMGAGGVQFAS
jgi:hypothetical protein